MLFELLKRRIGYLKGKLRDEIDSVKREQTVKLIHSNEEIGNQYVMQVQRNVVKNKEKTVQLEEREKLLKEGINIEQSKRLEDVRKNKEIMAGIEKQYINLLRSLEDKEYTLLRLKDDQSEAIELEFTYRVKEKEVAKLEQQNSTLQNHMEKKVILLQTDYLKVLPLSSIIEHKECGDSDCQQVHSAEKGEAAGKRQEEGGCCQDQAQRRGAAAAVQEKASVSREEIGNHCRNAKSSVRKAQRRDKREQRDERRTGDDQRAECNVCSFIICVGYKEC
eukprot:TRINITY_DN13195_c0_g1_i2.p1 TRINITY_DN13195_c0_g1~~TRINITY_DN13195_c0_g1_i2.p1  ORF type:complete len:277 (+),score=34.90 TRINITY_DN13195_c0_g1_i2:228-1058(+)